MQCNCSPKSFTLAIHVATCSMIALFAAAEPARDAGLRLARFLYHTHNMSARPSRCSSPFEKTKDRTHLGDRVVKLVNSRVPTRLSLTGLRTDLFLRILGGARGSIGVTLNS